MAEGFKGLWADVSRPLIIDDSREGGELGEREGLSAVSAVFESR